MSISSRVNGSSGGIPSSVMPLRILVRNFSRNLFSLNSRPLEAALSTVRFKNKGIKKRFGSRASVMQLQAYRSIIKRNGIPSQSEASRHITLLRIELLYYSITLLDVCIFASLSLSTPCALGSLR
ncbi:hypothetical protein ALC62_03339 [Cyphomyrmex costatus]|uniref:Uncharacterized protein n=1 Tax=Cyphomyrmex costatus TaxID=456900 RepID=A0A195CZX5_9HYME|nr:hypothetical protein ALC62_03339 [Cyphomyrmex costatus]